VTGGGGGPVAYFWRVTSPSGADTSALEVSLRAFRQAFAHKRLQHKFLMALLNVTVPEQAYVMGLNTQVRVSWW
jgi:hypothetical protein